MCGRYAAAVDPSTLVEVLEIAEDERGEEAITLVPADGEGAADFNMAPTKRAPVALTRAPRGSDASDAAPSRRLKLLTWGLVPFWAKDPAVGTRMINARAETLLEKRSYAKAARTRRCLVPATGWYEWAAPASPAAEAARPGSGIAAGRKQPFFMTRADGEPVVMGGIYEFWRDPAGDPDAPASWLTTFAVVTTAAEPGLDRVHDRMPLVLDPQAWEAWLDPAATGDDDVLVHLAPQAPGRFCAHPVGGAVGNVRSNSRELIRPLGEDILADLR